MTRLLLCLYVILLVASLSLFGLSGCSGDKSTPSSEASKVSKSEPSSDKESNSSVPVVYATRDIAEGETISTDDLEEHDTPALKAPVDCLNSSSVAVGRIAKYGIPAGQILSMHDLAPYGKKADAEDTVTVIIADENIPAGTVITKNLLKEKKLTIEEAKDLEAPFFSIPLLEGRASTKALPKDTIITYRDARKVQSTKK